MTAPPRIAVRVIALVTGADDRDTVLGDLHEEFALRSARDGVRAARRWYRRQMWLSVRAATRGAPPWGAMSRTGVLGDLRAAWLACIRHPGMAITIVLTLGIGIGANATIFTIVNALLLRPLPVTRPDELVTIERPVSDPSARGSTWSTDVWHAVRDRQTVFASVMAWAPINFSPVRVDPSAPGDVAPGLFVSGTFFPTLGISPAAGRLIGPDDDRPTGGADSFVAVLSYEYCVNRYGASPSAIGRTIEVGSRRCRIIGVTPPGFTGPDVGRTFSVALPVSLSTGGAGLSIGARLKSRQTLQATEGALGPLQDAMRTAMRPRAPASQTASDFARATAIHLRSAATGDSALRGKYAYALNVLLAAVAALLLVACANVTNLLLVRGVARQHELSVRAAIGASRWQLVRQLLLEAAILASGGAALALVIAQVFSRLLVAQVSTVADPITIDVTVDARVVAFAAAVAFAVTFVVGIGPAWKAARSNPASTLRASGRSVARGGRLAAADGLVMAQMALSLVLVFSCGLLVRTFVSLAQRPLGFDADRLLVVGLDMMTDVPADALVPLYRQTRDRAATITGVSSAALAMVSPIGGRVLRQDVSLPQGAPDPRRTTVSLNAVSPEWFPTVGTALLRGRNFSADDRLGAPPVVVVNESLSRALFGGANPIGQSMVRTPSGRPPIAATIVGVVPDTQYGSLREPLQPIVYLPLAQLSNDEQLSLQLVVRASGARPEDLSRQVSSAIADPRLRLRPTTITAEVANALRNERLSALLAGVLGALSLTLACIGLYGVTKYAVESRRRELGIRMLLGSAPGAIVWTAMRRVAVVIGAGLASGLVMGFAASRLLASMLFDVTPRDAATAMWAVSLLLAVGAAAAWRPLAQTTRIDPIQTLRES